jgi:hypothetical protein
LSTKRQRGRFVLKSVWLFAYFRASMHMLVVNCDTEYIAQKKDEKDQIINGSEFWFSANAIGEEYDSRSVKDYNTSFKLCMFERLKDT